MRLLMRLRTRAALFGFAIATIAAGAGLAPAEVSLDSPSAVMQDDLVAAAEAESVALGRSDPAWSVTPQGALTYSVPIEIPAGRGGMQPKLSLVYSSHTGNGLAGVGWSVMGFPEIDRVADAWGINYQGGDTFAANWDAWGVAADPMQKLVPLDDGSYHTFGETWGDYRGHGQCGDGPCF